VASAADNRTLKQLAVSELKTEEIDGERKVKLFKIGIDASAWMHSVCAVFQFNHAGAGKSPELRTLFFWLGTLLKLPLHVVFVFDGLKHLPEKGRMVRNSPHWLTCDFQRMLELFGFNIQAPGEAEAELATMNAHGVIDAAMTKDSDILIFGAPCIIRSTKKDKDYLNVEVYTEDGLEHGASLAQGDRLLIALLAGGDYDEGVSGCGIKIAHKVAQHSKIGQEMLHAFLSLAPELFSERAKELVMELHSMLATDPYHFLGRQYKAVADSIPLEFPRCEVISKYVDPITSFSATRSSTLAAQDVLSCQPHLADIADFCRVQFGWDDDTIIERMYGGIWEGAYLCTLCKVRITLFVDNC
ncbi:PIN domain-like protein, partial [Suillus subluteus]